LTPLQFGVPNSRLRYYLLAARPLARPSGAFVHSTDSVRILRHIPGHGADWCDARSSAAASETTENDVRPLRDYLDTASARIKHAVPERVLAKWGRLFDIVLPSATRTCCFTRGGVEIVDSNIPMHVFDHTQVIRDWWSGRDLFSRRTKNLTSVWG
jgi:tRNA (cytosine38-C5)-methyltransferase